MKKSVIIILFFFSLFIAKDVFATDYQANIISYDNNAPIKIYFDASSMSPGDPIDNVEIYTGVYPDTSTLSYWASDINWNWGQNSDFIIQGNTYPTKYFDIQDIMPQPYTDGIYWLKVYSGSNALIISYTMTSGVVSDPLPPTPTISSITPSYPVNTTIQPPENLNQTIKLPVTLTGSYTNIDEYNYILVYGLDEGILGREYVLCESDIGESGDYSCSVDFWTNKTYNYEMIMTKTPAPSSPSISSGVKSFSIGEPFISSNDFLTSDEEECDGYTDIYCHLKNAFRWGFIPSKATFYDFVSLSNKIMERAPFGYAKIIYQKLENLQIDETNNLELVSLEAIDEMIYNPFRVAFSYILYFIFVVGLYFRFRNINI